jgi:hypothetical protein
MKRIVTFLLTFGIPMLCSATTPAPGAPQCAYLNHLLLAAESASASVAALGLLERVAMGHAESIDAEIEKQPGQWLASFDNPGTLMPRCAGALSGLSGNPAFQELLTFSRVSSFRTWAMTAQRRFGRWLRLPYGKR